MKANFRSDKRKITTTKITNYKETLPCLAAVILQISRVSYSTKWWGQKGGQLL